MTQKPRFIFRGKAQLPFSAAFFLSMKKRVTFYFDGFNFYFGLRSKAKSDSDWKKYYWINFHKLCEQFIDTSEYEIVKIKYFTAPPLNEQKRQRQMTLLSVNKLLNPGIFEVVPGKYYDKYIDCPNCYKSFSKPEEKRTDVNISVHLIGDCALDKTDILNLISADSDLVPPLEFIKENYPYKKVKVYFPPGRNSADIFNLDKRNTKFLENSKTRFENSIMEKVISIGGKTFFIPAKWEQYL